MTNPPTTISVDLGERSYPILIGQGLISQAHIHLAPHIKSDRCIIITDEKVAPHWLETLERSLQRGNISTQAIILPSGEATKSFTQLEKLLGQLLDMKPDRRTTLIALGGGVIGDITGFAASILLRGISFIQIPTTLLSQVDSSVGGKTGINTQQGKNLVGSFYQPQVVLIDTETLSTLPEREMKAGYAEIVKYGCIDQPDFFSWLEEQGSNVLKQSPNELTHAIATSCQAKAAIVAADEREGGKRALLNLGHTFGHSLEAELGYDGRLLHGEAVAIGIIMATDLSVRLNLCPAGDLDRLKKHWQLCGLPVSFNDINHTWTIDALLHHMRQDKKNIGVSMTFILTHGIGKAFISHDITDTLLRDLLADYC